MAEEKYESKKYESFEDKMDVKLDIDLTSLVRRYTRVKDKFMSRDIKMSQIKAIREGRISQLAPDLFPETGYMQEPTIANSIDIAARDMAELISPLPSFSCTNPSMISERSRENATLKTKIVQAYVYNSNLQVQMLTAADWYVSYGFLPFKIECDYEQSMPTLSAIDPIGCYYEEDRFNNIVSFYQRISVPREELVINYPEFADKFKARSMFEDNNTDIEVILYHDKNWDIAFVLSGGEPVVLEKVKNKIGKVLVRVAKRPGLAGPRGQFDDTIYIQLAQAHFARLQMRAAEDSIEAPLATPLDVQEVSFGDGAILKSATPQNIRRVPLEIPSSVLAQGQSLQQQFQIGSRFPQTRTGILNASIITGRGVEALEGGYESQTVPHKAIFARIFQELVSLMMEVDEKVFAGITKELSVSANGTPVSVRYTPEKVIKGDYSVDVQYGLDLGLDPNRWLVFALQARADKMFSRDFMRRNFPMDIDVEEEAIKADVEQMEEALLQSLMGWAQSIPVLAGQGQDPSAPVLALTNAIDARKKGQSISEAVKAVMLPAGPTPEEIAAQEAQMAAQQAQMAGMAEGMPMGGEAAGEPPMGGEEGVPEGLNVLGLMRGTAPGQQGMAPGGRPDLATLMAGLTSRGEPNLQANITRNVAI
jgi:hypothetical protein